MYFFTADEHYGHENIIKYCNRPFINVEDMDIALIHRHNEVIGSSDVVVHAGDFTMKHESEAHKYIRELNGHHIFLKGSHDYWLGRDFKMQIWEEQIEGHFVVVCHYAMRTWARSHHNSWQLYGHSHGKLSPIGKQLDIGVDSNNFTPLSFEKVEAFMSLKPDNPNFVRGKRGRHNAD